MRIGIIGAMPEEVEALQRLIEVSGRETRGLREYLFGTIEGKDVVLVFSRMGKVACSSTATTLINHHSVDLIVFTGVAGGIDPEINVGDVVVGTEFVQHDIDISPLPEYKKFEIPLLGLTHLPAPHKYTSLAYEAAKSYLAKHSPASKVHTGIIISGDQFIASPEKLHKLREEIPGALCVEMEGAALAQVCFECEVPFVVIRSISDKADSDAHVDFPKFLKEVAAPLSAGLVQSFLREI